MATFTCAVDLQRFPASASVAAYPASQWTGPGILFPELPSGSAADTATVSSTGSLVFDDVSEGVTYNAGYNVTGNVWRWFRFTVPATPNYVSYADFLALGPSGQIIDSSTLESNKDIPQVLADMADFGTITIPANPEKPVYVVLSCVTQKRTVAGVGGTAGLIGLGLYDTANVSVLSATSPTIASNDFWTAYRKVPVPASKLTAELVLKVRGQMGAAGGKVNASVNDPAWIGAFYG